MNAPVSACANQTVLSPSPASQRASARAGELPLFRGTLVLLVLGLTGCDAGFQAASVFPRRAYEDSQRTIILYGSGFVDGMQAQVVFRDPSGQLNAEALLEVATLDEHTLSARLPDLSGRVEHLIFPYQEFVAYSGTSTPGLYDCQSGEPVLWTPGSTGPYCDSLGNSLKYAPFSRTSPAVPPGSADGTVLEYAHWYDSLATCTYYRSDGSSITEAQLELLIPDYELGCFYLEGEDGARTYQYCPARLPTAEVTLQVIHPNGSSSEIVNGLSLIDSELDYYYHPRYGTRVMGAFGAPYELALVEAPFVTRLSLYELEPAYALPVVVSGYADGSSTTLGVLTEPGFGEEVVLEIDTDLAGLAVGDATADGTPDLVYASADERTITLQPTRYDEDALALVPDLTPTLVADDFPLFPADLVLVDMNRDGRMDVVVIGTMIDGTGDGALAILLANPAGGFLAPDLSSVTDGPVSVAVADLDAQNGPDIVVGSADSHALTLCINNGSGDCTTANTVSLGSSSEPGPLLTTLVRDTAGRHLPRLSDIDGDGQPDIVYRNAADAPGTLRKGSLNTSSAYVESTVSVLSIDAESFVLADINQDGSLDVMGLASDGKLQVGRNDGGGGFEVSFETDVWPVGWLLAGDLDYDADPDLLVVGPDSGSILLLNNPSTIDEYLGATLQYCFL